MPGPVGRTWAGAAGAEGWERRKGRRRECRQQMWQNLDVAMESSSWIFPLWPAIKNVLFSFCQHTVFIFPFHIRRASRGNSASLHSLWPHCGLKYTVTWHGRAGTCNAPLHRVCSNSGAWGRQAVHGIRSLLSLHMWKMASMSQSTVCPWLIPAVPAPGCSSSTELCICLLLGGLCQAVRTHLIVFVSLLQKTAHVQVRQQCLCIKNETFLIFNALEKVNSSKNAEFFNKNFKTWLQQTSAGFQG